ncbi:hypothetical protein J3459_022259 [Metarhizium acridum]|nr:hypothetical protein J3459_022259 [Metarhizium acridum]
MEKAGASTKLLGRPYRWSRDSWPLLSASGTWTRSTTKEKGNQARIEGLESKVLLGSGPPIVREFRARQEIPTVLFFKKEERSGASMTRDMGHLSLVCSISTIFHHFQHALKCTISPKHFTAQLKRRMNMT